MGQYFTNDPNVKSQIRNIDLTFKGKKFDFSSDNGVFSKEKIDQGSIVFLNTLFEKAEIQGKILDLGCGYGTIGLILASFYHEAKFLLVDINTRACALARVNKDKFNLTNVEIRVSDCFDSIQESFDVILINPPIRAGKKVIYKMFLEAYRYLNNNGKLYIVIRKDQGAKSASNYIESVFNNCTMIARDKGYYVYEAIKEFPKQSKFEYKEDLQ